ncbi:MAG: hypothetical protein C0408_04820 [Odoribacter sp.]|nr:hypothetical protein [Odoribacter sp.]
MEFEKRSAVISKQPAALNLVRWGITGCGNDERIRNDERQTTNDERQTSNIKRVMKNSIKDKINTII